MKLLSFSSLRTRLTFWFLVIAFLPLATALTITYFQRVQTIQSATFDKLTAIRDIKKDLLQSWISDRKGDLKTLASDNKLADLESIIGKDNFNQNDIKILNNSRECMGYYLEHNNIYTEIFIINPNTGRVMVSTDISKEGDDKTNNEYYTKPMQSGDEFVKDIYYSKSISDYSMTFSIPVLCYQHQEEHIIGILVMRIDLNNSLYPMLLDRVGLGLTGETLIVNKDVMALNDLMWIDNAPLNLQIKAEPAILASQGKTGITVTDDYRGEKILAAYTYIPETEWGFVCKQDLYELNAPIRELIRNIIILFIVTSILIYVMAVLISRSISKPIVEMNLVSQKIQEGDLSARNIISSTDELGTLALSFNNMTETIESRIHIQKNVASIYDVLTGIYDLKVFGTELLNKIAGLSEADMAVLYIIDESEKVYKHYVSIGANKDLLKPFSSENPEGEFGNIISTKSINHIKDIPDDTIFRYKTTAGEANPKEIITIPILIDNHVAAILSLVKMHRFDKNCIEILQQSSANINSSYEAIIANERTRLLAERLSEMNLELTSRADELKSQTDELQKNAIELQQQNREVEMQRQQVETANKLKSQFLSNMSHELRTPLNSILALSRVLIQQSSEKLTKEENDYLEIVERNGKQLLALINDILDLSKIEAGKVELISSRISLKEILEIIIENIRPLAVDKGLDIKLSVQDDLPVIETDEGKLYTVLQNVIGNSIKFTNKGGVDISAVSDGNKISVTISDTGIGIPEEELPFIFDEFRQLNGTASRQYGGTGLGLAIASKTIMILGGDIHVESEHGKGSVFTIIIPFRLPETSEIFPLENLQAGLTWTEKKSILVVDDNPKTVEMLESYLKSEGFNTISATSGKKALELAEKLQPFAITLDIIMPEMDGLEVLEKLKSNPKTNDIPVIMVTVSDDKGASFVMGAVGYISKPVDNNILLAEINRLYRSPHSVMIVDDNDFDREQMAEALKAEKISVVLAENGKTCLTLLHQNIPDVLVLDIMMPEMDGFQVLEEIRKEPETIDLPVIIVTAKDLSKKVRNLLQGKVSAVLTKTDSMSRDVHKEIQRILLNLDKSFAPDSKRKKHILLAEDNEATVLQVKAVLENEGYLVDMASGGQEAIDFLHHTIPDGIILDLMMTGIDGFEVLKEIRNSQRTRHVPVLVLTAKDLTKKEFENLRANNIQQLVQKGDIDLPGLLFKIQLMLGVDNPVKKQPAPKPQKTKSKKVLNKPGLPDILLIEDNQDNVTTIGAIVKNKYNLHVATNGERGLAKAQSQIPDLILLDIALPGIDGIEVVKRLKENDLTKDIRVMALTAYAMKEDREIAINAGCDDYMSKPVDPDEFLKKIENLLK